MKDIKHYANRVVPQHKQPNFIKWLSAHLEAVSVSEKVMRTYDYEFDIDNATGAQLDTLGDIVGRKRLLNFQPSNGSSPYLDDEIYRILLKAKININHWNGTIPGMYESWNNFFPEYKLFIKDNQDMTMTAYLEGLTPSFLFELIVRDYIIPRPEGVGFKLSIKMPTIELPNPVSFAVRTIHRMELHPFNTRAIYRRDGTYKRNGEIDRSGYSSQVPYKFPVTVKNRLFAPNTNDISIRAKNRLSLHNENTFSASVTVNAAARRNGVHKRDGSITRSGKTLTVKTEL